MSDYHYYVETGLDGGGDEWTPLYWAEETPTKEGWYWANHKEFGVEVVKFCVNSIGHKYVTREGRMKFYSETEFSHWLGPLPEPEI